MSSSATTSWMPGILSPPPSRLSGTTSTGLGWRAGDSRTARFSSETGKSTSTGVSEPRIGTFPTALQRTGDFSDLLDTSGRLVPIYDPATTRPNPNGTGFIRDVFPGNVIPANRLDPVALKIQENSIRSRTGRRPIHSQTPTTTEGCGGEIRDMRQYTVKVDHRFSTQQLTLRPVLVRSSTRRITARRLDDLSE